MIRNKLVFFFKNQIWRIGGLIFLFYLGCQLVNFDIKSNSFIGHFKFEFYSKTHHHHIPTHYRQSLMCIKKPLNSDKKELVFLSNKGNIISFGKLSGDLFQPNKVLT